MARALKTRLTTYFVLRGYVAFPVSSYRQNAHVLGTALVCKVTVSDCIAATST